MYRRLDGRVKKWATLNEPWVVTDGGYLHGAHGARPSSNLYEAPIASHHLMRAHGKAVRAYRAEGRHEVGPGRQPGAQARGQREGRKTSRQTQPRRRLHEPAVPRPGVPRRLSRRDEGHLRRGLARVAEPKTSR